MPNKIIALQIYFTISSFDSKITIETVSLHLLVNFLFYNFTFCYLNIEYTVEILFKKYERRYYDV